MLNHEYVVLGGFNRAKIGHAIGLLASASASAIAALYILLIKTAETAGLIDEIPSIVIWPLGIGVIYGGLYWLFEKHVWKTRYVSQLLQVPNLAGEWDCDGLSLNADKSVKTKWQGRVTIVQSWDKIRVHLVGSETKSSSISAALLYDEAEGYRLMYSYVSNPKADATNINSHRGHAELVFNKSLDGAAGEYFNGITSFTFGTLTLRKIA